MEVRRFRGRRQSMLGRRVGRLDGADRLSVMTMLSRYRGEGPQGRVGDVRSIHPLSGRQPQ
eukprot:scaffold83283_cov50-Cyclotella_meneghiniana.AAC.1